MFKKKIIAVLACILTFAVAAPSFATPAPFADVPMNHWSYDAIRFLAANGIVSGYEDAYFHGDEPATRYEMASIVAKSLEAVDKVKASERDMRMIRALVVEFGDELQAMGVRGGALDVRIAALEENLGGWRFGGTFTFDMNWGDADSARHSIFDSKNWNEFTDSYLSFTRTLKDGSYVYGRLSLERDRADGNNIVADRLYWQGHLGSRLLLTAGRFNFDWESDAGVVHHGENAGWFNNGVVDGFRTTYASNRWSAEAIIARNIGFDNYPERQYDELDAALYAVRLNAYLSERVSLGAFYSMIKDDGDYIGTDITTYGGWLDWEFMSNISLKGMYYAQDLDDLGVSGNDPKAWKAALEFDQKLLRFTSLWVEYGQVDKYFAGTVGGAYNWSNGYSSSIHKWGLGDANMLLVRADQKWNDKWGTFVRYGQADFDLDGGDTVKNWTVGVNYQMTPAVGFQLAYDDIDYGNMASSFSLNDSKDKLIRFRTVINF